MTLEDEEFTRVEMESRIKQEYIRNMKTPTREQLMAEVTVLTEMVRVLSDRVNELQILNQPTWFIDSKHATQQRTWVGLTEDEVFELSNTMPYADRFKFAQAIEAKLKEKNI